MKLVPGHQWLTLVILATWKAEIGRIMIQGQPREIVCETPLKISRPKWAQTVECLFCKHEALSSNHNPTKKKKKKNPCIREAYSIKTLSKSSWRRRQAQLPWKKHN
jgi:hypothetical protein